MGQGSTNVLPVIVVHDVNGRKHLINIYHISRLEFEVNQSGPTYGSVELSNGNVVYVHTDKVEAIGKLISKNATLTYL